MTAHDPMQKETATERKQEKINEAEMRKQETREHNAAAKQQVGGAPGGVTSGFVGGAHTHGTGTGMNQMAAMPGHGTGQPAGYTVPGSAEAHPVGVNAGTGRTVATNPRAGGETNQGYGTGGSYS